MINYRSPITEQYAYFLHVQLGSSLRALGPFQDIPDSGFDSFEARDPDDFLYQSAGPYGENDVSHRQFDVSLTWSPHKAIKSLVDGQGYYNLRTRLPSGMFGTGSLRLHESHSKQTGDIGSHLSTKSYLVKSSHGYRTVTFQTDSGSYSSRIRLHSASIMDVEIIPTSDYASAQLRVRHSVNTYNLLFSDRNEPGSEPISIDGVPWPIRVLRDEYPYTESNVSLVTEKTTKWWTSSRIGPKISLAEAIREARILLTLSVPAIPVKSHGELAQEAVEQLDANNVNMIAFLKDLRKPWELIPKLKNLSKLKTHAGNYLGYEYGILPTISDLKEIYAAVTTHSPPYHDRNRLRVLSSGASNSISNNLGTFTDVRRCKLALNEGDPALTGLSESLHTVGGFPSLNNLWDLVPYSFVLDWFLNIGDMLEQIDYRGRVARLDVVYSTTSSKIVHDFDMPSYLVENGFTGYIRLTSYIRETTTDVPTTPLNFEGSNELPNHWLEAGALIIARTK